MYGRMRNFAREVRLLGGDEVQMRRIWGRGGRNDPAGAGLTFTGPEIRLVCY